MAMTRVQFRDKDDLAFKNQVFENTMLTLEKCDNCFFSN